MNEKNMYDVLALSKYEDKNGETKTSYKNVGVGFPMKEKKGLTLYLDAHAVSGNYIVVPHKTKEEREKEKAEREKNRDY